MKYIKLVFLAIIAMTSCQIEDDSAPKPDDTFIKYYGELSSYVANDIEIIYDDSGEIPEGFIVFGSKLNDEGDNDYFILRTDLEGILIDSTSYGFSNQTNRDFDGDGDPDVFRGDDIAGQITRLSGGGYVTIGTSSITDNVVGISDFKIMTIGFITPDLELVNDTLLVLTSEPNNTELDLIGNDVLQLADGSILIVGAKEFDRGGGITDTDNYYAKIDLSNGNFVFEETQGVAGEDENDVTVRAFEKANGNLVMIGYNNTPSLLGENNGNNGANAFFLELDPNGTPVNSAAYGLEDESAAVFNEQVNNAIKTGSGFAIVGTTNTSDNRTFAFLMNLSNNGVFLSANNHDSSAFDGIESIGEAVTQTIDNKLAVLGQYPNFIFNAPSGRISRGREGMFVKFDQASNPVVGAEAYYGLVDGADNIVDAVTLPDGRIVAVANVDFGGGVKLISIIKLNDDGSLN